MKGAKANRNGLQITHLLFADDCIVFGKANLKGSNVLKNILKEYEDVSGQLVNFEKSTTFFSKDTNVLLRVQISNNLRVKYSLNPEKYLGLPNMAGR